MLSSEQKDEVCDATDDDSSNIAGNTIIQLTYPKNLEKKEYATSVSPPRRGQGVNAALFRYHHLSSTLLHHLV